MFVREATLTTMHDHPNQVQAGLLDVEVEHPRSSIFNSGST